MVFERLHQHNLYAKLKEMHICITLALSTLATLLKMARSMSDTIRWPLYGYVGQFRYLCQVCIVILRASKLLL